MKLTKKLEKQVAKAITQFEDLDYVGWLKHAPITTKVTGVVAVFFSPKKDITYVELATLEVVSD